MLLHRLETGWSGHTDDHAIAHAAERLAELAEEIGKEDVERIVAEVEDEYRQAVGDEVWRLLQHGMAERGLPELEIRSVPGYLADVAGRALRQVCEYMQEPGVEVRLGETMQIGPNSVVRLVKLPPIPGSEDHYEVERWAFAAVGMTCAERGETACTGHPNQS